MKAVKKIVTSVISLIMTLCILFGVVVGVGYLAGYRPYIVISGSMEPTIHTGSLSIVNSNYDYDDVVDGDIIAFKTSSGLLVTHRVLSKTEEGIVTKGDANEMDDGLTTTRDNFEGLTVFSIPQLGFAVATLQTKKGKILAATGIAVLFILSFAFSDDEEPKKKGKKKNKEEDESPLVAEEPKTVNAEN